MLLPIETEVACSLLQKLPDRVHFACRDDVVLGLLLLDDPPHRVSEVGGVSPVSFSIEVAHKKLLLEPKLDCCKRARNLSSDKGFAAPRTLVIEQDPV